MISKIKNILGSIRFWVLTLTAVIAVLTGVEKSGFMLIDFLNIVQVWLLAIAGLGTLDSVAAKINKK